MPLQHPETATYTTIFCSCGHIRSSTPHLCLQTLWANTGMGTMMIGSRQGLSATRKGAASWLEPRIRVHWHCSEGRLRFFAVVFASGQTAKVKLAHHPRGCMSRLCPRLSFSPGGSEPAVTCLCFLHRLQTSAPKRNVGSRLYAHLTQLSYQKQGPTLRPFGSTDGLPDQPLI